MMKRLVRKTVWWTGMLVLCACSAEIDNGALSVVVAPSGKIASIAYNGTVFRNVSGTVRLDGYEVREVQITKNADTVCVSKQLADDGSGRKARMVERFFPSGEAVRWSCEVTGDGEPCSVPIRMEVTVPASDSTGFWTAWGRPQVALDEITDERFRRELKLMRVSSNDWLNPLVPVPFADAVYHYGAPAVSNRNPQIAYCPVSGDVISVPVAVVTDERRGNGISFVQALDDYIQDLSLETSREGRIVFSRFHHRLAASNPIRFSCDIVGHAADWRESLAWICGRYPAYFEPENPLARTMGGTGAYTTHDVDFDAEKMKEMAFSVNWRASFDFPYMGMFLPPVGRHETWTRFGGGQTSQARMAEYAAEMKERGFYVLNYFNVTEFGASVDPEGASRPVVSSEAWKNSNDYLFGVLKEAILTVPDSMNLEGCIYPKTRNGGMFFTWGNGVVLDCGVPVYADFLLEQAQRHLDEVPEAFGFCIDRMDWLRMFNLKRDDGRSWFDGRPAGSLVLSWNGFMDRFAEKVHGAGKVIFVNNHTKRVDLLRHADGIFDEFTHCESALNATSFTALKKPFLGWTPSVEELRTDGPDNFFQKYLYMGAFPMCPFPGNDHSIRPDEWGDRQYLDYGPLMRLLVGREWVLEREPVRVVSGDAKANAFRTPEGYVFPVVFAGNGAVRLELGVLREGGTWTVEVWYPGEKTPETLPEIRNAAGEVPALEVPVSRGCAMLRVRKG